MSTKVEKPAHVAITVTCPHCKSRQVVHILARLGASVMGFQPVQSAKCCDYFDVNVPEKIIDGPFPVE
jgi:hypothetical protein